MSLIPQRKLKVAGSENDIVKHAIAVIKGLLRNDRTIVFSDAGTLVATTNVSFEIPVPVALTILRVYINVKTAPTGATLIVDVNKGGTTIFTTQGNRPTIAISAKTAESGTPDVTTLAKNDILSIDVDQIGSTIAGADLVVQVRCEVA